MRWKKIEILLLFIHNACGYTSSASTSSAPSPRGEGFLLAFPQRWNMIAVLKKCIHLIEDTSSVTPSSWHLLPLEKAWEMRCFQQQFQTKQKSLIFTNQPQKKRHNLAFSCERRGTACGGWVVEKSTKTAHPSSALIMAKNNPHISFFWKMGAWGINLNM